MLYPKKDAPLTPELFRSPTSEYRAAPFWAWNNKLDEKELTWQIEQLKALGFGGFHMHVRTGLETEYLGGEYMSCVKACVEKAKAENMLAWLYDEDRWPSGAAGGYVTQNEQYRLRHLLLTRTPYEEQLTGNNDAVSSAGSGRTGNGILLACYDVQLSAQGELAGYRRIDKDAPASGFKLYAYLETALPSPWFNNQTYADTLNPDAIKEFIRVTYEAYNNVISSDFGGAVPAIFTDEPQFAHKGTLSFAGEEKDVTLPWTGNLADTYKSAYLGEDLLDSLPELLWELPNGKVSTVRYHYHDHIAERFAEAFADQCGDWCEKHGIMLTGHMMEEPTLKSQTAALGDAMRSYRSFQIPGIDMLCDWREYTTAKQAQSAARQYGRPGVMSELYGVTNWDFDFRGHKLQGDWQAALGVTVRVPHLSWVSMNGEAKRDYPSTFNYQSPWYREYPYIEDHFARVNTAMTRGEAVCRVGVIHPVESYWLHWGANESTQAIREQMDSNFQDLTEWLLRGLIDFDFISESLLPEQCPMDQISADGLPVGMMCYEAVLVPPVETLRSTTLERLEAFKKAGGRIIFTGEAPALTDAVPSKRGQELYAQAEHVQFNRTAILAGLEALREIDIRDNSGAGSSGLFCQLRSDGADRWLFVCHCDKPVTPDIPEVNKPVYRIRLRGEWDVTLYGTICGEISPLESELQNGWTVLSHMIYEHDSLLLRLSERKGHVSAAKPRINTEIANQFKFLAPVPVTLHEPNVLLLDMAEYALDDEPYHAMDEILRLDNVLRAHLGWPLRGEAMAQPWLEQDTSPPRKLRLRYVINSSIDIQGAELALENALATKVTLNGMSASTITGWHVDKCISKVALPEIKAGENILELDIPYGIKTDVEACYLLGDFGVQVNGCACILTEPVKKIFFGDITRQGLPFYGGNLTYHLEAEIAGRCLEIEASHYRGHLLRVSVDGRDAGVLAFSPYRLRVPNLAPGKHKIDITCFGSRVNTFGQLHRNDRYHPWWGPQSWRTNGASWTWEYRFWEQGIMKTPEVYDLRNANAFIL